VPRAAKEAEYPKAADRRGDERKEKGEKRKI
jgi:hypothetical protein